MEKIVGRIMLAFLCVTSIASAGMSLRVTDDRGTPIKQVVVGEECKIQVITSGPMRDFQLNGINAFTILTKSTITQSVNGSTTYKYIFTVRADELGSYKIGPATAEVEGVAERSDTVPLQVVAEPLATPDEVKRAFVRLNLNKKNVVIGEQITGSVRFYCCEDDLSLDQIVKSDLPEFVVDGFSEPQYGKEVIDDIPYTYIEVTWSMSPKKIGCITIPAWGAHYSLPALDNSFGPFRFMHGLQRQQKRVYSNAVQIDVHPLPPYDGPIHGVGNFDDIAIHANSQVTKEGEANVIRLDVTGDGTLDGYEPIQLTGIPDALKSYDSKKYTQERSDGAQQTSYEFIVQGLKAGDWEIPAQEFTYFDVSRKQYVTHKTMPLLVSVSAQPGLKTVATSVESEAQSVQSVEAPCETNSMGLSRCGSWHPVQYREIPFSWFLMLLLVPLSGMSIRGIRNWYAAYQVRQEPMSRKKYAHVRAYKAVCDVEKRKAYHELYPIFIELFASRSDSPIPECSDDAIIILLRDRGMPQDDIAAWQRFFTDIMRLAYAGSGQQNKVTNDIIKRAYEWLGRLKGVL